jgi:hypothetical protein
MYKTIIGILGAISLSFIYYYILDIPKLFFKFGKIKLVKPFSCPFCMSFWFSFTYLLFNSELNLIDSLFAATLTPILYLFIEDKLLSKWNF